MDLHDPTSDSCRQFDAVTRAGVIAAAVKYRWQAEENIPLDFSTNPPALRNYVFLPEGSEEQWTLSGSGPCERPQNFLRLQSTFDGSLLGRVEHFPLRFRRHQCCQVPRQIYQRQGGGKNSTHDGDIGDFDSCSIPKIEFGQGFDGRKEIAFRPTDTSELIKPAYLVVEILIWSWTRRRILSSWFGS